MAEMKYDKIKLAELLDKERKKEILLPNFQRQFVWNKNQIKSLVASLLAGVPIGGLLLSKGSGKEYASRPLCYDSYEYKDSENEGGCEYLLDGQQRISAVKSVCSDLFSNKNWKELVKGKEKKIAKNLSLRWVLKLNMDADSEKDIFGLNENLKTDFDLVEPEEYISRLKFFPIYTSKKNCQEWYSPEAEVEKLKAHCVGEKIIPLWLLCNDDDESTRALHNIIQRIGEDSYTKTNKSQNKEDTKNSSAVLSWAVDVVDFLKKRLLEIEIPYIKMPADKVSLSIAIFEQTNRGGTVLSVYDLIVARYARISGNKNSFSKNLTQRIQEKFSNYRLHELPLKDSKFGLWKDNSPTETFKSCFLNCLAIECFLVKNKIEELSPDIIKKTNLLKLDTEQINDNLKNVLQCLNESFRFMNERLGIRKLSDLPYQLMALPIYCAFRKCCDENTKNKCEYWYWSALFSAQFGKNQNTKAIDQCRLLHPWCCDLIEENPFGRYEENIFKDDDVSLETLSYEEGESSTSAIEKGLLQLILSNKPMDFDSTNKQKISMEEIFKEDINIEIHHIFPLGDMTLKGKVKGGKRNTLDTLYCPLNKTWVLGKTNNKIGNATSFYETFKDIDYDEHYIPQDFALILKRYNSQGADLSGKQTHFKIFCKKRFELIKKDVAKRLRNLIS